MSLFRSRTKKVPAWVDISFKLIYYNNVFRGVRQNNKVIKGAFLLLVVLFKKLLNNLFPSEDPYIKKKNIFKKIGFWCD